MDFLTAQDHFENVVFKVSRIGEDIDYGCEDRLEHSPIMAAVFLTDPKSGKEYIVKVADASLSEKNIQEGDLVTVSRERRWSLTKVNA